jgi:methylenetetrahydrofolate dehydrogenase (NADP+)/methenyltetrahydrofolate cyclohydrolase
MKIIDGKKIAAEIREELKEKIAKLSRKPGLAFILVGDNPASLSYVNAKKKACAQVGMISTVVRLPSSIAESDLCKQIDLLNQNPEIDGILVQLPLPSHINPQNISSKIDPGKDVDGFHPVNMGKLLLEEAGGFIPCTPNGIKTLLERSQISISGKHVVIVGRSNIVGKPLAALLVQKNPKCNATVTIVHSKSNHLSQITKSADILVAALGKAHFIKKDMIKPNAVIIDVGINRLASGQIVGDVDYEEVFPFVSHITPVPGGIGPMTIAMLLENTLISYSRR